MKRKINIGCIIKVLLVVSLIMGVVFFFLTCSGGSCIHKIDKTLPDIQEVPWVVTTPTHLYYAKEAIKTDAGVSIIGWYEQVKDKWVYQKESIFLEYKIYGKIMVERR